MHQENQFRNDEEMKRMEKFQQLLNGEQSRARYYEHEMKMREQHAEMLLRQQTVLAEQVKNLIHQQQQQQTNRHWKDAPRTSAGRQCLL